MKFDPTICRLAICMALLIFCGECLAQIKIIPQSRLDSVANPRVVGADKMLFKVGMTIDFATLDEDAGAWQRVLEWQNKSSQTIVITHIKSSCSCLRGEFEREGVRVGQSGKLKITYYPKGHPGMVNQRLFIYTHLSASEPTVILSVKGVVKPSKDHSADYKYSRGELLLRQDTLYATRGKQTQIKVACMNSSQRDMRLSADTLLSSKGIKMWSEPRVLKAGTEGDLVITISSDARSVPQGVGGMAKPSAEPKLPIAVRSEKNDLSLYISGLRLSARERMLVIKLRE